MNYPNLEPIKWEFDYEFITLNYIYLIFKVNQLHKTF